MTIALPACLPLSLAFSILYVPYAISNPLNIALNRVMSVILSFSVKDGVLAASENATSFQVGIGPNSIRFPPNA
jgi:hypothetical protein